MLNGQGLSRSKWETAGEEPIYITNGEESGEFRLDIDTGRASMLGEIVLTPSITSQGIRGYELSIEPAILSTGKCRKDCSLKFKVRMMFMMRR